MRPDWLTGDPYHHSESGGRPLGERCHAEQARAQFVRVSRREGVLTVRPIGPVVGQREAPIIREHVLGEIKRLGTSIRIVILDLSDVTLLASMGLGALIDIRNEAQKSKARSILYGLTDDIEHLIRMMRIERLYTIARSRDDLARYAA